MPRLLKRNDMGYEVKKTEHSGSKKGCGAYWGRKADAKKNRANINDVSKTRH
jgi:hypothetical protein